MEWLYGNVMKVELDEFDNMFFSLEMNMNDTFGYACADSENMDWDDFKELLPLIKQHGHHVLDAYAALKRGHDPIPPLVTDEFIKCKELILQKMKNDQYFCPDHNEEILARESK